MTYSKSYFTSSDGLKLHTHSWMGDVKSDYVMTLIHGIGEHAKRYDHVAEFFVKRGFSVMAFDLRGHGQSEGKRGHTSSFKMILDDIEDFFKQQKEQFPEAKHVLYGHSLGGHFLLNMILSKEIEADAVVASSPALKTAFTPPPLKVLMGKLLRSIYPSLLLDNGVKASDLSKADRLEADYVKDPLVHNRVSIELALSSIEQGVWALDNASKVTLPLLIIHGTEDKITSHKASELFIKSVEKGLGTLKLYDGLFHELHHEEEAESILSDVYEWILEVTH